MPDGATSVNFFYRFSFNDRVDEAVRARMLGPGLIPPNADVGNRADVSWEVHERDTKGTMKLYGNVTRVFTPTPLHSQRWRELSIEVRPNSIQAEFDGLAIDSRLIGPHMDHARKLWAESPFSKRSAPLAAHTPNYFPRGSLGLYVDEGRASFCDVVIEPLPEPVEENP